MSNTNSPASSAHVTLATADLETIHGGASPGFPADAAGTALGMGVSETFKQRGNIADAFNSAHAWGHEKGWNAINAVGSGVSNFFNPPAAGNQTYTPASMGPGGSVTPGSLTPN